MSLLHHLLHIARQITPFYLANFLAVTTTTIYLHRGLTHRGVEFPKWLSGFFKFTIWIFTSILTRDWVGVHRQHHARADMEGDPHSPWVYGIWTVQFWNVALYGAATKDRKMIDKRARDIPTTRMDRLFFKRGWLGILIGSGLFYLLFGLSGLIGYFASGIIYVFVQSSTVNGLGHYPSWIGYQNYKEKFAEKTYNLRIWFARILIPWGIGGEELHNNHHGDARSAIFAHKKWEFDFGGVVLRVLAWLNLAKIKYTPKEWERVAS